MGPWKAMRRGECGKGDAASLVRVRTLYAGSRVQTVSILRSLCALAARRRRGKTLRAK